jgi:hypothetical protein
MTGLAEKTSVVVENLSGVGGVTNGDGQRFLFRRGTGGEGERKCGLLVGANILIALERLVGDSNAGSNWWRGGDAETSLSWSSSFGNLP